MPRVNSTNLRANHTQHRKPASGARHYALGLEARRRIGWSQQMQTLDQEQSSLRQYGKQADEAKLRVIELAADSPLPTIDFPLEDMPHVLLLVEVVKRAMADSVDLGRTQSPRNIWFGRRGPQARAELLEWTNRPGGSDPFGSLEAACDVLSTLTDIGWDHEKIAAFIQTNLARHDSRDDPARRRLRIVPRSASVTSEESVELSPEPSKASRRPSPASLPTDYHALRFVDAPPGSYRPNTLAYILHDLGRFSWPEVAELVGAPGHTSTLRICRDADGSRPIAVRSWCLERTARLVRLANLILGWVPGNRLVVTPQQFGLMRVPAQSVEEAYVDWEANPRHLADVVLEADVPPNRESPALRVRRGIEVARRRGDRARMRELEHIPLDDEEALQVWYRHTYPYLAEDQPDARKAGF